jgi:L-ascorbate metabolism protein UlaG (beta-lactamase superfamily)
MSSWTSTDFRTRPGRGPERPRGTHKRRLAGAALAMLAALAAAPPAAPQDQLELQVVPLRHATLALRFGEQVIIVDPVAGVDYRGLPPAAAILITDTHPDHWHMETVAMLMDVGTKVVAPPAVADQWGGIDTVLENGEMAMITDITIEAVPMYNLVRGPREGQLYHPMGRGNGYVVDFGLRRIYISGDTECTPEMRALEDIDIAFVAMNMPYTMPPSEAAECVRAFKPKVVYPYHYRGSDLEVFEARLEETPEVEVRLLDWYPAG